MKEGEWRSIVIKLRESKEGNQRGYKLRHTIRGRYHLKQCCEGSTHYSTAHFRDKPVAIS